MPAHFRPSDCAPDARRVYLKQRGGCSEVQWSEAAAAAMPRTPPVTYVNVGANKGYKIPEFLALWSQRPVAGHMKGWQRHLLRYADAHKFRFLKTYSCGNCGDCNGKLPKAHSRHGARMHLLELASANRALLQYVIEAERLSSRVELHNFAASNHSHTMLAFKGLMAGDERGTALIGKKAKRFVNASAADSVQAVSLDDFLKLQRLEPTYHVAIDTEGWDALVVEGMRDSIAERRVALIEFEVNNRGMWNRTRHHGRCFI